MVDQLKRIEEYWKSDALSQSFLKKVLSNDKSDKKDSVQFMVGSLVDCLLTSPELVDEWFYVSDLEKYPSPQIKEVLDLYYNQLVEEGESIIWNDEKVLKIFRNVSNSRTGDAKVLEMLYDPYWKELEKAEGRKIVSKEYWTKCMSISMNLFTNPVTREYFQKTEDSELLFQYPLYWKYKNSEYEYDCKGLADIVILNHKEKTVRLVDLKTTSDNLQSWKYNVARRFRYDIQLSFYNYGLHCIFTEKLPDYIVLNPIVIVENVDFPGKPRVFELNTDDLYVGRHGCERQERTIVFEKDISENALSVDFEITKIYGWEHAIGLYHKSLVYGLDDFDIEYHENKGNFSLNLWT